MNRRCRSTSNFIILLRITTYTYIYYRKFQLPSAKSTRYFALVITRITALANVCRKLEEVVGIDTYHVNLNEIAQVACFPGIQLGTMALTEKQQKILVCDNKWIRRIVGVKRADKRKMDEMRVGMKESLRRNW